MRAREPGPGRAVRLAAAFGLVWVAGCVDKAPPPLWPAPPPPAVAELLGDPEKKPTPLPALVPATGSVTVAWTVRVRVPGSVVPCEATSPLMVGAVRSSSTVVAGLVALRLPAASVAATEMLTGPSAVMPALHTTPQKAPRAVSTRYFSFWPWA